MQQKSNLQAKASTLFIVAYVSQVFRDESHKAIRNLGYAHFSDFIIAKLKEAITK